MSESIHTSSHVKKVGSWWRWTVSRETKNGTLVVASGFEPTRADAFDKCGEATDRYRYVIAQQKGTE
jgi:hypothetical protein